MSKELNSRRQFAIWTAPSLSLMDDRRKHVARRVGLAVGFAALSVLGRIVPLIGNLLPGGTLIAVFAVAFVLFEVQALRRESIKVSKLVEDNDQDIPVRVGLTRGFWLIGADEGVMWLESGIVHFAGSACAFAIRADQIDKIDDRQIYFRDEHDRLVTMWLAGLNELAHSRLAEMIVKFWASRPSDAVPSDMPLTLPPTRSYRAQIRNAPGFEADRARSLGGLESNDH